MSDRLPPLTTLRAFEAAARLLSFKKAAAELHVTPAAVSQQIKLLEGHLGVELFRRLTRALDLTPEGMAILPRLREGLSLIEAALESVRARPDDFRLTVCAPPSFAARWLVPRLARFAAIAPDIELHLASSLNTIDHQPTPNTGETAAPQHTGNDVEIRYGNGHYPGFQVDRLFAPHYLPVCSPQLADGKRSLREPRDLRWHALIHDETIPDEADRPSWATWLQAAGVSDVDPHRGPRFSNAALALGAAADGLGVVLALDALVSADLTAGRLVAPFALTVPSRLAYYLTTPIAIAERPEIAIFRTWLLTEAAGEGTPDTLRSNGPLPSRS